MENRKRSLEKGSRHYKTLMAQKHTKNKSFGHTPANFIQPGWIKTPEAVQHIRGSRHIEKSSSSANTYYAGTEKI